MKTSVGALLFLTSFPVLAATIIHAGELFDANKGIVLSEQTVIIEEGQITTVAEGYHEGNLDDTVIDLKNAFVMPGLLDMHVHIITETSPEGRLRRFTDEPGDYAYRSIPHARRTLLAGFTTVRDLGSGYGLAQSMRDAITAGKLIGPRIYAAGKSLATSGGHADPTNGVNAELRGDPGPTEGVVNSVEDGRKAVRTRYKEGSDLIKITATGGVLSQAKSGENPQFTIAEIEAIVATAKDYGFKVAAHAHGAEGMRRAVVAGVDSIEHGTLMNEEVMRLMKKKGTWFVPTIAAGMYVAEKAKVEGFFSELVRPKAAAIGPKSKETFAKAYQAGVKIAFGTDTGVPPHGENWREFVHMVDAGMPAAESLVTATKNAAQLLGVYDQLGSIEAGKLADIVAFPRSPLLDIAVMGEVSFVMKEGEIYKQNGIPAKR
ncbi:MAG: amidohydrolase family protein [Pseudomonadales bacterium]|nr:amidohydrolase family protein [Pseudomonadales bacterium]